LRSLSRLTIWFDDVEMDGHFAGEYDSTASLIEDWSRACPTLTQVDLGMVGFEAVSLRREDGRWVQ